MKVHKECTYCVSLDPPTDTVRVHVGLESKMGLIRLQFALLALDPVAHEFCTCMNSNCKLCLRAKQAAKSAKKQKKSNGPA